MQTSSLDDLMRFREEGIFNYSTILLRDDLGVLLVGAREAIYALDVSNISVRKSAVRTHNVQLHTRLFPFMTEMFSFGETDNNQLLITD